MPNYRKRRGRASRWAHVRKREAASSIQSAWRRRKRRKRGGLVKRTALAAYKGVKNIRRNTEQHYANNYVCQSETNWCGQIASNFPVNNRGYPFSTMDFYNATTGGAHIPDDDAWVPTIMRPLMCQQGPEEDNRQGNDIRLTSLTVKGMISASSCGENNGTAQYVPFPQRVTVMFILDTDPVPENSTLKVQAATPPTYTWEVAATPMQLFPAEANNPVRAMLTSTAPPLDPTAYLAQSAYLKNGPKLAAGGQGLLTTNISDSCQDLLALSYYSKDYSCKTAGTKRPRFKILKKKTFTVRQWPYGGRPGGTGPAFTGTKGEGSVQPYKAFSMTLKGNYHLHFRSDGSLTPMNQQILIAFVSDTPAHQNPQGDPGSALPDTTFVVPPKVSCAARFSFKDI